MTARDEIMEIRWITQKEANRFVVDHHRHHGKVVGSIFQLGLFENGILEGVAIVGRPVARKTDYRKTLEVTRLCTKGIENGCSKLYAACARIAKEMGFEKIQTFILESESGTSLKASGWEMEAESSGGSWSVPSRKREVYALNLFGVVEKYSTERKQKWSKVLN